MPKKRKGAAAKIIPQSYLYPLYGYTSQPLNNSVNNSSTQLEHLYYPVDEHGIIIGPPTTLPPIVNPQYQGSYSYHYYPPISPLHGSYLNSPRRDSALYDDYYYYHRYPYSDHSYERSRRETLPPLYKIPYPSPMNNQFPQVAVRDLTERDSTTPVLTNPNTTPRN